MLADLFSSSYKQYKNDTSAFTTWLGQAAEACGYKPQRQTKLSETINDELASKTFSAPPKVADNSVSVPRLKGKARKVAKQALRSEQANSAPATNPNTISIDTDHVHTVKKYAVSTQEPQEQIEILSQSKASISMPATIQKLLKRDIDAWRKCSEWCELASRGKPEDELSILSREGHRHLICVLEGALSKVGVQESAKKSTQPVSVKQPASKSKDVADIT